MIEMKITGETAEAVRRDMRAFCETKASAAAMKVRDESDVEAPRGEYYAKPYCVKSIVDAVARAADVIENSTAEDIASAAVEAAAGAMEVCDRLIASLPAVDNITVKGARVIDPAAASKQKAEVDKNGVAFNADFCAHAKEPFYTSGAEKGTWKKRKNVPVDDYDAWYAGESEKLLKFKEADEQSEVGATIRIREFNEKREKRQKESDAADAREEEAESWDVEGAKFENCSVCGTDNCVYTGGKYSGSCKVCGNMPDPEPVALSVVSTITDDTLFDSPPHDCGSLMVWISGQQAAGRLTQAQVTAGYGSLGLGISSLFPPTPPEDIAANVGALYAYLERKSCKPD